MFTRSSPLALSHTLSRKLQGDKYGDWAANLTERSAEALFWAIGECHLRMLDLPLYSRGWNESPPPPNPPQVQARMAVCFRIVTEIVYGREIDVGEVRRRVREAMAEAVREMRDGS